MCTDVYPEINEVDTDVKIACYTSKAENSCCRNLVELKAKFLSQFRFYFFELVIVALRFPEVSKKKISQTKLIIHCSLGDGIAMT